MVEEDLERWLEFTNRPKQKRKVNKTKPNRVSGRATRKIL